MEDSEQQGIQRVNQQHFGQELRGQVHGQNKLADSALSLSVVLSPGFPVSNDACNIYNKILVIFMYL